MSAPPCAPRSGLSLSMETIVIGNRNPDMDSVCSAVAYAALK